VLWSAFPSQGPRPQGPIATLRQTFALTIYEFLEAIARWEWIADNFTPPVNKDSSAQKKRDTSRAEATAQLLIKVFTEWRHIHPPFATHTTSTDRGIIVLDTLKLYRRLATEAEFFTAYERTRIVGKLNKIFEWANQFEDGNRLSEWHTCPSNPNHPHKPCGQLGRATSILVTQDAVHDPMVLPADEV
jgi:hypothetical protein